MIILENNLLSVKVLEKGAELCSIVCKASGTEYLWQADPAYWNKHSPILFPIVGTLRNDTYLYQGKSYTLSRHGFARDKQFKVKNQESGRVRLELEADEATLQQYPFLFSLQVTYELAGASLNVSYTVVNKGAGTMYFSIGGHPAFNLPINKALQFEDYTLQFEQAEQAEIYPLNADGQLLATGIPFLNNTDSLPLQKSLFYADALIFKKLKSGKIRLASGKDSRYIEVSFEQFPFLGIWSKKDADFICIEPWQGITDDVDSTGHLKDKKGIIELGPAQEWRNSWTVQVG
ncbi:MAG: aldose 1-epimerase family protein [Taibaiella sp.]|nr:aldose 1-epimerase family protein [Taibaiella sp.]